MIGKKKDLKEDRKIIGGKEVGDWKKEKRWRSGVERNKMNKGELKEWMDSIEKDMKRIRILKREIEIVEKIGNVKVERRRIGNEKEIVVVKIEIEVDRLDKDGWEGRIMKSVVRGRGK